MFSNKRYNFIFIFIFNDTFTHTLAHIQYTDPQSLLENKCRAKRKHIAKIQVVRLRTMRPGVIVDTFWFMTSGIDAITTGFICRTNIYRFCENQGQLYRKITFKQLACVGVHLQLRTVLNQTFSKAAIAWRSGVALNKDRRITTICVENQHHH